MKRTAFLLVMAVVSLASCGKEENVSYNERRGGRNILETSSSDYSIDFSQVSDLSDFNANFNRLTNDKDDIGSWKLFNGNLVGSLMNGGLKGTKVALLKRAVPNSFEIRTKIIMPLPTDFMDASNFGHSAVVLNYVDINRHLAFMVKASTVKVNGVAKMECYLLKRKAGGGYQGLLLYDYQGIKSLHCGFFSSSVTIRIMVNGRQFTAEMENYPTMKLAATLPENIVNPIGLGGGMLNLGNKGMYGSFSFVKR